MLKKIFFLVSLILLISPLVTDSVFGQQNLSGYDLSRVKSSDISDSQLKQYIEKAEQQGVSINDAFNMARARGLSPSVANELMQRVEQVRKAQTPVGPQVELLRSVSPMLTARDSAVVDSVEIEVEEGPQIFGSSLFKEGYTSFEPYMNIPTPVNYVLGAGDEIVIDIWGAASNFYQLQVSPEGSITIENVGPVYVHGLTIEEASSRIIGKLKQLYGGLKPGAPDQSTFARVTLGRVRSIQVTIIGEVVRPGTYTVPSLATVFNVLYNAGGPNDIGSYRQIEVLRNNTIVSTFDLYDLLLNGDQSANIRLNDQDVIRVATVKSRVETRGQVRRPALYELNKVETLADLVEYSGGFTDSAYTRQVRIIRNTEKEKMLVSVSRDNYNEFQLLNGDIVEADKLLDRFVNRVTIEGAVWRPADYELTEGMTLSQLIYQAEGLKPDAFRSRGIINRLSADYDFVVESFDVDKVVKGEYDVILEPEDHVIIKSIHEVREERTVDIQGEVLMPGTYQFRDGMTLEDLILVASGFKISASEARIEVNRRVFGEAAPSKRDSRMAETYVFGVDRNLAINDEAKAFKLAAFDKIYVRPRPDYQEQQSVFIEGEVLYPGEYVLSDRRERISDIIKRVGGLTDEAYIKGATLIRKTKEIERAETEIQQSIGELFEVKKKNEITIGIDLEKILARPGSHHDIYLSPGDVLRIPGALQTVKVSGGVLRETEIRYDEGKNLKYYVRSSGGFAQNARRNRAYVVYANGDVDSKSRFLLLGINPKVEPGSEIVIPLKPEQEPMSRGERISILSAIVSMSAVVITAISRF